VTVNGAPIAQHQLRDGDRIGVGATTIAYAERAL
jgi:pSer/pThr/pTyr-binding forkhead associated (FHA) protein